MTDIFALWPATARHFGERLRAMILDTAAEAATGPLTETLKWGQPAFLTQATKAGTTVRIGYEPEAELPGRLYVHCGTNLVERYRALYSPDLTFDGNRAIHLAHDLTPEVPIRSCIAMALTYHRDKKGRTA